MSMYSLSFSGITPSVIDGSNQALPIKAFNTTAGVGIKLWDIYVAGESGSSTITRLVLNRPTTVAVTWGTTQTPQKCNPFSAAAAGWTVYGSNTAKPTAGTQPVHALDDILDLTLNTYGSNLRWVPPPGCEILVLGLPSASTAGELVFGSSRSGAGVVSGTLLVEQL